MTSFAGSSKASVAYARARRSLPKMVCCEPDRNPSMVVADTPVSMTNRCFISREDRTLESGRVPRRYRAMGRLGVNVPLIRQKSSKWINGNAPSRGAGPIRMGIIGSCVCACAAWLRGWARVRAAEPAEADPAAAEAELAELACVERRLERRCRPDPLTMMGSLALPKREPMTVRSRHLLERSEIKVSSPLAHCLACWGVLPGKLFCCAGVAEALK